MVNDNEEKLKKFLFDIINKFSKDADVYYHRENFWLIHTEDRKWIVEFTKERTLWFNYDFFKKAFKVISLDVQDNKNYVTEWFELRFLNKSKVENDIQNGVKSTRTKPNPLLKKVEDTIQNGVRRTTPVKSIDIYGVENNVQNVRRNTRDYPNVIKMMIDDTVENGVRHTEIGWAQYNGVENAIENGVKCTQHMENRNQENVENVIEYGVKEIKSDEGYMAHFGQQYK
jgi:hypothetical protein